MKRLGCKVIMMLFISVSALAWTKPINISNTPMFSHHGAIAVGQDGIIHVAWEDGIRTDSCRIMYCCCKGDSWSEPTKISDASMYSGIPDIVVDTQGNVHVSWTDYGAGEIYWSFFDGDTWSTPFNISDKPYQDFCARMAINRQANRIHMVWHEYSDFGDIWYSLYDSVSWSAPQNITNDSVESAEADIAVDSEGHPHVVWMDYGDMDIHYFYYNGSAWSTPVNISYMDQPYGQSGFPRIALDSKDFPHVVWEERYEGYHIYYSVYSNNSWSNPYRISDKNSYRPVIAVDSNGIVHIAWNGEPYLLNEIYYRFCNGNSWSSIISVSQSPQLMGGLPDIAADAQNYLHLVWTEAIPSNDQSDIYYSRDSIPDIPEDSIPTGYGLKQNIPNPFNSEATISYELPKTSYVTITIYDTLGREVKRFYLGLQPAGYYNFPVNFEKMGAGVYFYRLVADGFTATGKMVMFGKERG